MRSSLLRLCAFLALLPMAFPARFAPAGTEAASPATLAASAAVKAAATKNDPCIIIGQDILVDGAKDPSPPFPWTVSYHWWISVDVTCGSEGLDGCTFCITTDIQKWDNNTMSWVHYTIGPGPFGPQTIACRSNTSLSLPSVGGWYTFNEFNPGLYRIIAYFHEGSCDATGWPYSYVTVTVPTGGGGPCCP